MGLRERLRGALGGGGEQPEPVEPPLDEAGRRRQLDDLEEAVRQLARSMAGETARMTNPGWSGRVEEYRWVAAEAARLSRHGFTRAELLDLANEVRPLYVARGGEPPAEYAEFADEQDQVLAAAEALRAPLPSETPPPGQP